MVSLMKFRFSVGSMNLIRCGVTRHAYRMAWRYSYRAHAPRCVVTSDDLGEVVSRRTSTTSRASSHAAHAVGLRDQNEK